MLRTCISTRASWKKTRQCLAPLGNQCRPFSDVDRKRQAENAARLRALRKPNKEKKAKAEIDYRLQKNTVVAPKDLWGSDNGGITTTTPVSSNKRVLFFDEVDAKMNQMKTGHNSIASLFENLDRKQKEKAEKGISLFGSSSAPKSIFDAFPLEPRKPVNPNGYEKECYDEYLDILNDIVGNDHFQRKATRKPLSKEFLEPFVDWLRCDEKTCNYEYPTLQAAIANGIHSVKAEDLRDEVQAQKAIFLEKVPLDKKQYEQAKIALLLVGNNCAKTSKPLPLDVAWEKCKEAGMLLGEPELNIYLFASTQFAIGSKRRRWGLSPANSILSILDLAPGHDDDDEEEEKVFCNVPEEIATFRDVLYDPTEQSLTVRVRALVAKGDALAAQSLLDASELEELRHRTYQPILKIFLDNNEMTNALSLFRRMQGTHTCKIEPETYVQVIAALAEHGHFKPNAKPIDGIDKIGYSPSAGPLLLDQVISDMAEDVLEITSASARRLYSAFELSSRGTPQQLHTLHPLAPVQLSLDAAGPEEIVASRVTVNQSTGQCPCTKATLRLINLDSEQRARLREGLINIAKAEFKSFNQSSDGDKAGLALESFADWLDQREGAPFTAIIDGPNAAYFMQNFDEGKFNIHQLQFLVQALEDKGENPLVILPNKYSGSSFNIFKAGSPVRQHVSKQEKAILQNLIQAGKLYVVPARVLDDYFWMLASVSDQINSRKGESIFVEPGNPEGRWPGARPMLVSNDQMRDHKLELIEPRLFRRWYACHIVNYNFTGFVNSQCVDGEIGYSPADVFSREIQGNPSPLAGEEGSAGMAWHFPVEDWPTSDRFVLRYPNRSR